MIIIKIVGGLASQLHKYAIGRALSIKYEVPLKLDISWYENIPSSDTIREYQLDKYNINADIATKEEISKYKPFWPLLKIKNKLFQYFNIDLKFKTYCNKSFIGLKEFNTLPKNIYLEAEWSGYKYFEDIKDVLDNEFTLKNGILTNNYFNFLNIINDNKTVSLHVRRGDYVHNKNASTFHVVSDLEYYKKALNYFVEKFDNTFTLLIFSDDMKWVKKNLIIDNKINCFYIENTSDNEEFELLRRCNYNIIANSGFSWFSSWLNSYENKIVIAPKRWMINNELNNKFLESIKDEYTLIMENINE